MQALNHTYGALHDRTDSPADAPGAAFLPRTGRLPCVENPAAHAAILSPFPRTRTHD